MSASRVTRAKLSPERSEEIRGIVSPRVGYRLSSAIRNHWRTAAFTTWEEAVEELRGGIEVTLTCMPRGRRSSSRHALRFNPDGSIELLNHDGPINEAAERVLSGLGNRMAHCTAAALCYPQRLRVDDVGLNAGARQALDGRLRVLWAAVSWAQDPDTVWCDDLVETTLRYGVSLPEARAWLDAGWTLKQARLFWAQWADFTLAEQWRAAGRTDPAAAVATGLGEAPDDDARWREAGFTMAKAARWRKNTDLSPEEAYLWESFGCPPSEVANLKVLPRQVPTLTMDTVLEWCRAGVPARQHTIRAWWDVTGGDLALSAKWAPSRIAPAWANAYEDWNRQHPDQPLSPDLVGAYRAAGFPCGVPAMLARARSEAVTPNLIRAALSDVALLPPGLVGEVRANWHPWPGRTTGGMTDEEVLRSVRSSVGSNDRNAAVRLLDHLVAQAARA